MFRKKWICLLAMVSLSVFLVGCGDAGRPSKGSDTAGEVSEQSSSAENVKENAIVIKHAFGETVIPGKPSRIVTVSWGNQDTPLALGVAPVGVSAANYGVMTDQKLHPWVQDAFKKLGVEKPTVFNDVDGFNYEAISDAKPDVILAAYSGMKKEEYEMLSKIAPTVAYPGKPWQTLWRDATLLNATAMGMKEEGEKLIKNTETVIQKAVQSAKHLKGTKACLLSISAKDLSNFYLYLPADPRTALLQDLGLDFPESVKKLSKSADDFYLTLSREQADQLTDVELIVVYGDHTLLEALQKDPLLSKIPAVRDGAVALVTEDSPLAAAISPTVLSLQTHVKDYVELLDQAASHIHR